MQPFNDIGAFLVHKSDIEPDDYSLSIRDAEKVMHYRICRLGTKGFFVTHQVTFKTIPELVQYYQKQAGGLCNNLIAPCLISKKLQTASLSKKANKAWEIDRKSICLFKTLGAGQFGEVWQGVWNATTEVAVKVLKVDTISSYKFLQEAALMKQLRHPNLIQLYAVCTKEEPIYIITELMKHGSLLDYLRGDDDRSLKLPQLIDMGAQVSSGMAFLEEKNYVHGDLAARNILVGENLICKVADFGLANMINEDIYEAHAGAKFSKWTAPEVAMYNCFTIKSDVWSFGVCLYELITYGSFPYLGMKNIQLLKALRTGYRMPCPIDCPTQLYDVMMECWRGNPACRPTFHTLQQKLEEYFYAHN